MAVCAVIAGAGARGQAIAHILPLHRNAQVPPGIDEGQAGAKGGAARGGVGDRAGLVGQFFVLGGFGRVAGPAIGCGFAQQVAAQAGGVDEAGDLEIVALAPGGVDAGGPAFAQAELPGGRGGTFVGRRP